jgi:glyoxylase-like metal-dependent hydrolase (beta-lactamase superfamily II)
MSTNATYRWTHLRAGRLLLDGGSMFGVVPHVVWSRSIESDDKNRIELAHNCLLLERVETDTADLDKKTPTTDAPDEPQPPPPQKIVIETGTGDKLDDKMASIFGLDGTTVESALIDAGHKPADIDAVVVTHLHFDHAGGLTRRCRDGEDPDWTADQTTNQTSPPVSPTATAAVKLTFPNATIHTQLREWNDATANTSVMTRTYYRDHLDPLLLPLADGRDRLVKRDSPRPYPTGYTPKRDEFPKVPIAYRETEIAPGLTVFLTPGHTWGQQAIKFTDVQGRTIVFTPDVMPSVHHLGAAYSLAYDVEPYTSMVTRHWLLEEAVQNDWLLFLDHEPGNPLQRVSRSKKGWYDLSPVAP